LHTSKPRAQGDFGLWHAFAFNLGISFSELSLRFALYSAFSYIAADMKKPLFLALEGIDGSGKSTQTRLLKERLEQAGYKVYSTFEPTDSPIGKMIRDIFSGRMEGDHRVIAGLFVADRLDHLLHSQYGLLKKLEEGHIVITDRYYFSSYAYHGTHMSMPWVIEANALAAELLRPDLNIYIDISPEESMKRLQKGRAALELYETLDNLKAVRDNYFEAFRLLEGQEKIFITESKETPEEVAAVIWEKVSSLLKD
jgi:dTMP kinase